MGILEAATQRMKMEEANYEARIAALQAELETVKGELAAACNEAAECYAKQCAAEAKLAGGKVVAAWIEREALAELTKHKNADAVVCSGLVKKPFGDKVPLYTHPAPTHNDGSGEVVLWQWRTGRSTRHAPDQWEWSAWKDGRIPDHVENRQYRRYEERALGVIRAIASGGKQ